MTVINFSDMVGGTSTSAEEETSPYDDLPTPLGDSFVIIDENKELSTMLITKPTHLYFSEAYDAGVTIDIMSLPSGVTTTENPMIRQLDAKSILLIDGVEYPFVVLTPTTFRLPMDIWEDSELILKTEGL